MERYADRTHAGGHAERPGRSALNENEHLRIELRTALEASRVGRGMERRPGEAHAGAQRGSSTTGAPVAAGARSVTGSLARSSMAPAVGAWSASSSSSPSMRTTVVSAVVVIRGPAATAVVMRPRTSRGTTPQSSSHQRATVQVLPLGTCGPACAPRPRARTRRAAGCTVAPCDCGDDDPSARGSSGSSGLGRAAAVGPPRRRRGTTSPPEQSYVATLVKLAAATCEDGYCLPTA